MDGVGGWVTGFCKTITSSTSAKARDEARAELGILRSRGVGTMANRVKT